MSNPELVPGLAGIPAAESSISFIDGQAGVLEYRGYKIEDLSANSTYEEVAWLLLYGELPTADELSAFEADLGRLRELPEALVKMIQAMPATAHPMQALQASLAGLGMVSPKTNLRDAASKDEACRRVIACTPVLVAAFERVRAGKDYVAPKAELSTAANFLWCLDGESPDDVAVRTLDCALILHAEHTMNASTFACRVVASTENDPYTSCSGAVGALFGPLHGGANERVLKQLATIGSVDEVEAWYDAKSANKQKVMGFGHRVYKTKDPRANNLQTLATELFQTLGSTPKYDLALKLEEVVTARLGDRGIYPNVDFFSGLVYEKLGLDTDVFTPIFAMARVAGYCAHYLEQHLDNKLFRPGQIYAGQRDRALPRS
ncbi:MAG: citrate/2-methylcitrate synthase [Planctomycetota bacterium]|nr:citrate/2-methylcitrate synthase [Planctomycetota bacterium]MEC8513390.1 citrate/2-methylcitrate synthase [Planctomycetota bacterium]